MIEFWTEASSRETAKEELSGAIVLSSPLKVVYADMFRSWRRSLKMMHI